MSTTDTAKRYRLTIEYDDAPECPCHSWDSLYEMFQGSNRYGHYANAETLNAMIDEGRVIAYGVNVYDHSGLHYWIPGLDREPAIPGSHYAWDVAQGGAVLMVKAEFAEEYAGMAQEQRDNNARGFLAEFNAYANGSVYACHVAELRKCDAGQWHEVEDADNYWIGGMIDAEQIAESAELPGGLAPEQVEFAGDADYMGPEVMALIEQWARERQEREGNTEK